MESLDSMNDQITYTCPECNAKLAVDSQHAGKKLKCPKCQTLILASQGKSQSFSIPPELQAESASMKCGYQPGVCCLNWKYFAVALGLLFVTLILALFVHDLIAVRATSGARPLGEVLQAARRDFERERAYLEDEDRRAGFEEAIRDAKLKINPDFEYIVRMKNALRRMDEQKKAIDPTGEILAKHLSDREEQKKKHAEEIADAKREYEAEEKARWEARKAKGKK
jgi:predicted Zn finger-like uncharacterized protein